jgi:hypothetical protein
MITPNVITRQIVLQKLNLVILISLFSAAVNTIDLELWVPEKSEVLYVSLRAMAMPFFLYIRVKMHSN